VSRQHKTKRCIVNGNKCNEASAEDNTGCNAQRKGY